jgi:hypothetical protein
MNKPKRTSYPVEKVSGPGIYSSIEAADYHADPCPEPSLSKSIAWIMTEQSAAHARLAHPRLNPQHEEENRQSFDLGTAAHAMLLESEQSFVIIGADNFRTKAAQEARDAAYAEGKTPLLESQHEELQTMVAAARQQLPPGVFEGGRSEETLVWREGDAWCRARLDYTPDADGVFWDYKTTSGSAEPRAFQNTFYRMGYHLQARFYLRGIEKLYGRQAEFRFVVQELKPPYAVSPPLGLDAEAEALGDLLAERAIRYWQWCTANNRWPGYAKETHWLELPGWLAYQLAEMNEARRHQPSLAELQAQFERSIEWQAPS